MTDFRTRLGREIIVFDGGVGTYLYEKGVFINTCFDELNLVNPDIVAEVHRDYANAGADVVETNTYGANQFKLAPHGLEKKVYDINRRGAEIAKAAVQDRALVAGSVGPLGVPLPLDVGGSHIVLEVVVAVQALGIGNLRHVRRSSGGSVRGGGRGFLGLPGKDQDPGPVRFLEPPPDGDESVGRPAAWWHHAIRTARSRTRDPSMFSTPRTNR